MAYNKIPRVPLADRLWAKCIRTANGCLEWQGYRGSYGYGSIGTGGASGAGGGRTVRTHQAAWVVTYGPIPVGYFVCHTCDNPPCCDPAHLFLGTPRDNTQDMIRKNRARNALGSACGSSRLTEEQVTEIRRRYIKGMRPGRRTGCSATELGATFGVGKRAILYITNGDTWGHILGATPPRLEMT